MLFYVRPFWPSRLMSKDEWTLWVMVGVLQQIIAKASIRSVLWEWRSGITCIKFFYFVFCIFSTMCRRIKYSDELFLSCSYACHNCHNCHNCQINLSKLFTLPLTIDHGETTFTFIQLPDYACSMFMSNQDGFSVYYWPWSD